MSEPRSSDPLTRAEIERMSARTRLKDHASELRARVSPSAIKQTLIDEAKTRADALIRHARKNPVKVVGAAAATALILFRKPLLGALLKRLTKEK